MNIIAMNNSLIFASPRKRPSENSSERLAKKMKISKVIHKNENSDDEDENEEEETNPFAALFKSDEDIFSENNHIYFRCEVNRKNATKIIKLIKKANDDFFQLQSRHKTALMEPVPIYLHITSFGGTLFYGLMIFDAIKRSKIPVHTIAEGHAISAGSIMLMGGVKKYATPNSFVLMHQLSGTECGTFEQLMDGNLNNTVQMKKIKNVYLENTKMKSKDVDGLLKRDLLLDTEKCLKYGIIDELYTEDK